MSMIEDLREVVPKIEALKISHHECEDPWYSCPKTHECADDRQGEACNCGAEVHNAKIDALVLLLRTHAAQIEQDARDAARYRWSWRDASPELLAAVSNVIDAAMAKESGK